MPPNTWWGGEEMEAAPTQARGYAGGSGSIQSARNALPPGPAGRLAFRRLPKTAFLCQAAGTTCCPSSSQNAPKRSDVCSGCPRWAWRPSWALLPNLLQGWQRSAAALLGPPGKFLIFLSVGAVLSFISTSFQPFVSRCESLWALVTSVGFFVFPVLFF